VVQYLVEKTGANVNALGERKWTPLHHASKYRKLEVVKYLLQVEGINIDVQDKHNMTPLHLARRMGFHEIATVLEGFNIMKVMKHESYPAIVSKEYINSLRKEGKPLGKGAFGTVYKVKDQSFEFCFALKQLVY
jgi:ankyrin repeat protein